MIIYTEDHIAFQIDEEDFDKLSIYKWRLNKKGHVCTNKGMLHHVLLGLAPTGLQWDHKDRNKLNNHKTNLRAVTPTINARNRDRRKDNTSGHAGVCYHQGRFLARIGIGHGRRIELGHFDTYEEALIARLAAEEEYEGYK